MAFKHDAKGHLWLYFSVIEEVEIAEISTGKIDGFDFGIKTFLTNDKGLSIESPRFFKYHSNKIAK